jgi:hypothetical protein
VIGRNPKKTSRQKHGGKKDEKNSLAGESQPISMHVEKDEAKQDSRLKFEASKPRGEIV